MLIWSSNTVLLNFSSLKIELGSLSIVIKWQAVALPDALSSSLLHFNIAHFQASFVSKLLLNSCRHDRVWQPFLWLQSDLLRFAFSWLPVSVIFACPLLFGATSSPWIFLAGPHSCLPGETSRIGFPSLCVAAALSLAERAMLVTGRAKPLHGHTCLKYC